MNDILATLAPHVVELVSTGVMLIIGWAATYAKAKWRIDIEARHREALHSAIMTGVRAALQRKAADPALVAVEYARQSVPDAVARFPNADLFAMAASKIEAALK